MPIQKLTSDEVAAHGSPYIGFLRGLRVGEGARASCKAEGVTKITLKKHLNRAADMAGVKIRYHRANPDTVILERVS